MRRYSLFLAMALLAGFASAQQKEELAPPDRISLHSVTIYPNPATDFLSVKFQEPQADKVQLTVHNIVGNVLQVETEVIDASEIRLRVKDLPEGYYFLAIRQDGMLAKGAYKFLKR
jgi:hypothetical protein